MSTEENKTLRRRFFEEVYTKKNLAAIGEFIAPAHIDHSAAAAGLPGGPEGSRQAIGMMLTAFPDLHVTIEDMIAEGDKVVVRMTMRGTQQGALGGNWHVLCEAWRRIVFSHRYKACDDAPAHR